MHRKCAQPCEYKGHGHVHARTVQPLKAGLLSEHLKAALRVDLSIIKPATDGIISQGNFEAKCFMSDCVCV